jgi:hypothetical protein
MKQESIMKKHNENIETEIGKTMELLDEMGRLEAHHLFRVRLMQRVEQEFGEGARRTGSRMSNHLDFRLAFMALLLIVNLGSAVFSIVDGNPQATATISELLDNQNDDYTTQEFAYYDQTATSPGLSGTDQNQAPSK